MSSSTYGTKNSYLLGEPIGAAQQDIVLDTLGRLAGCEQPSLPTFGIFGVHQLHEAIDLHSARVSGALGLMKNCQYAYISQSPSRSIGGTSAGRKPTPSHAKPWNRSWCNIERQSADRRRTSPSRRR
ncbi:hypothetical protein PsYK624_109150 [Phanerochaete sordida]|uniref:Uncharacterized protein n=1 Tax=Phanerochaete sordida TaxID=48140 RepID=A0A9P3GJL3_9APHY|nr:hypothetical protein PsYK624_109150 [Phanerochaete sordida]